MTKFYESPRVQKVAEATALTLGGLMFVGWAGGEVYLAVTRFHGEEPTKVEKQDPRYKACYQEQYAKLSLDPDNYEDFPEAGGDIDHDTSIAANKAADHCVRTLFETPVPTHSVTLPTVAP